MLASLGILFALTAQTDRAIEVRFTPLGNPQIAVWLERADGTYVDTIMVTRLVGTFGLGNRPGRFDFGGGYLYPYGRREHALPVWAHRRGVEYERIVMQDCRESSLGWHETHSSLEPFYCRPTSAAENSVDTITCPTTRFSSDKGMPFRLVDLSKPACAALGESNTSFYPPRNDITGRNGARDWEGVTELAVMNDLDAVSRATPKTEQPYRVSYHLRPQIEAGDYAIWVEVNQEFDTNQFHDYARYKDPPLSEYGIDERGQPSIVWSVPLTITTGTITEGHAIDYAGYGSPDGKDGELRPPDATITTDVPGSGEGRLELADNEFGNYRVHARFLPNAPCAPPLPVLGMSKVEGDFQSVTMQFDPPTETESIALYEVHYLEGEALMQTDEEFESAIPGPELYVTDPASFVLPRLRADTAYTIAIRTRNYCQETSPLMNATVRTETREFTTVDACFIATAAHGSIDQEDVVALRRFRDRRLLKTEMGRAFVDSYYRISPPIADFIRDDDTLRAVVRVLLKPFVWLARETE